MSALNLTPARRKALRADAHHLDPVVMIGASGLTDAVTKEADAALNAHGLIKIRVFGDDRVERDRIAHALCDALGAGLVQQIGKLLVLFRPQPEKTHVEDPDRKPGPHIAKIVKFSRSRNHRPQVKKVRVLGNQRVTSGGTVKRKRSTQRSLKRRDD